MVIKRTEGQTDIKLFDPVLAQLPVFSGIPKPMGGLGGFGFNWGLATQIAGWVISGIGIGINVVDAMKTAKDKSGVDKLEPGEISAIASQIAAADPQHRGTSFWEKAIGTQFGAEPATLPAQPPPPGYYLNPQTGQLVALPKEGGILGGIPTWGLALGGLMIYVALKKGGLKL